MGTKILLDAHNAHIAAEDHDLCYMGRLLREKWQKDYVTIGFAFGEGSFHALDWRDKRGGGKRADFTIGRPPNETLDAALALANLPRFVIDLRTAGSPVADWLASPQKMHHVSGAFSGPTASSGSTRRRARSMPSSTLTESLPSIRSRSPEQTAPQCPRRRCFVDGARPGILFSSVAMNRLLRLWIVLALIGIRFSSVAGEHPTNPL